MKPRHKKLAVLTWLVMVVAAFTVGQLLHTPNIQSYDTGQSGQAERTLNDLKVTSPPGEHVLLQRQQVLCLRVTPVKPRNQGIAGILHAPEPEAPPR